MTDHPLLPSRRMLPRRAVLYRAATLGAMATIALGLGSCVISERPLIVGSKPLLGDRFDAVLFRDFTEGSGYASQKVGYRWANGVYARASAAGGHEVRFAAEPLSGADFLIERSQDGADSKPAKFFTYFIARKIADGAYLVAPVNENDLAPADRDAICRTDQPEGFCAIGDHAQLMTAARASAAKSLRSPSVAVLTFGDVSKAASASGPGSQK